MLTILGIIGETEEELAKAGGLALNLWTGLAMLVGGISFYVWAFMKPPMPPELDHVDHYEEGGPLHMGPDFADMHPDEVERRSRRHGPATATELRRKYVGAPRCGGAEVFAGPVTGSACRWSRREARRADSITAPVV